MASFCSVKMTCLLHYKIDNPPLRVNFRYPFRELYITSKSDNSKQIEIYFGFSLLSLKRFCYNFVNQFCPPGHLRVVPVADTQTLTY